MNHSGALRTRSIHWRARSGLALAVVGAALAGCQRPTGTSDGGTADPGANGDAAVAGGTLGSSTAVDAGGTEPRTGTGSPAGGEAGLLVPDAADAPDLAPAMADAGHLPPTCGGVGERCCPGSTCGPSMVCLPSPGGGGLRCVPCGKAFEPCCAGSTCEGAGCCFAGDCLAPGQMCRTFSGKEYGACTAGRCACGGEGETCCPSATSLTGPGTCASAGLTCGTGSDPKCVRCGAKLGPCCADQVCTDPGTVCNGPVGLCISCGESGGLCCPADGGKPACKSPGEACDRGYCHACGQPGQPCCTGDVCAGKNCCSGGQCVMEKTTCKEGNARVVGFCSAGVCQCGQENAPCCPTGPACADPGARCRDGSCKSCGISGLKCCADDSCEIGCCVGGLCVDPGTPSCQCGHKNEPCCTIGGGCVAYHVCISGICMEQ
jgi:hypothetical protein